MGRQSKFLLMCVALCSLTALPGLPAAADWPNRQVNVIVPFGAGGKTDMMAQLASQDLSAKFGQTFVVENRPSVLPSGVSSLMAGRHRYAAGTSAKTL